MLAKLGHLTKFKGWKKMFEDSPPSLGFFKNTHIDYYIDTSALKLTRSPPKIEALEDDSCPQIKHVLNPRVVEAGPDSSSRQTLVFHQY